MKRKGLKGMVEEKRLGDVIPPYVYTGLGNRGREAINLIACMVPGCDNSDEEKLHILEVKEENTAPDKDNFFKNIQKIKIHCDTCAKTFILGLTTVKKNTKDENGNLTAEDVAITAEAFNESGTESYGNIGML